MKVTIKHFQPHLLTRGLIDVKITFGIINHDGRRDFIEAAKGFADVESGIEAAGLVKSCMIWNAINITLAEGFLEGIATIIDRAKEFPLNKREMLVDTLFE